MLSENQSSMKMHLVLGLVVRQHSLNCSLKKNCVRKSMETTILKGRTTLLVAIPAGD